MLALGAGLRDDERIVLAAFPGDPGVAPITAWKPRPYHPNRTNIASQLPTGWNGYCTVGAFLRAEDGTFRRRGALCSAGLALMVDDVGTKVDPAVVSVLAPSARIETSPGNEQYWYILAEPLRDVPRFDAMIRAFIAGRLLGQDPGMAGVTRVGRLPGFQNMKPQYGGWEVQLRDLNDRRFTDVELLDAFGLELRGRIEKRRRLIPEDAIQRSNAFVPVYQFLKRTGMLKKDHPDPSGWSEMTCPWLEEHTGAVDNGCAIREPDEDNGFYGGFRCHHGSHQFKNWRDLTEWVSEQAIDDLDLINADPPEFIPEDYDHEK